MSEVDLPLDQKYSLQEAGIVLASPTSPALPPSIPMDDAIAYENTDFTERVGIHKCLTKF